MTERPDNRDAAERPAPPDGVHEAPTPPDRATHGRREQTDASLAPDSARRLVYLAAERTLLSWIRVAIGLVVLGFAVDRFGLLLIQRGVVGEPSLSWSSWLGLALIGSGVATSIVAALHYRRFLARYRRGDPRPGPGIPLAIGLALLLAVVGVVMAIDLHRTSAADRPESPPSDARVIAPDPPAHARGTRDAAPDTG